MTERSGTEHPLGAHAPNHHGDLPGFAGIGGAIAGLTMLAGARRLASIAADLVQLTSADHVVDIGCGPGSAAREAASRGARVTAVDPADVMLGLARRLTRGANIDWRKGVVEDLPVETGAATVAWSLRTVHHWPDLDAGLAETARVLTPGGRFAVLERKTTPGATGLASHGWTASQADAFAAMCRDAGFEGVEVTEPKWGRHAQLAVRAVRGA